MGELITFASNGEAGRGYLATPPSGGGPGVVVIQEWWGLVPHIKDVCDRLAGEGFVALAPDLYQGATPSEPDEAQKAMMAMRLDQAAKDMSGAVDEVARRSSGQGVGVVGFCMGGGLALVLACQRPDQVVATVPYYGVVPWPDLQPDYPALRGAVQGHYASHDEAADPETVRSLEDELKGLGKEVSFFIYPDTRHGFFNDSRLDQYAPDASRLAWERTITFLHAQLG
ncbi:MAG TPA: dienelactone hydrolase family protein [Acidimicrobiales bacterium]|nr:dienelactone hydrolase family protein [Acidimicrobiales bacterium]